MDLGPPRKMQGARFTVRGSRIKKSAMAEVGGGPLRWWGEKVLATHRSRRQLRCKLRLQSARRFVDLGRAVKAAVLAAQPLAQVGDLEALAQMVCELARE